MNNAVAFLGQHAPAAHAGFAPNVADLPRMQGRHGTQKRVGGQGRHAGRHDAQKRAGGQGRRAGQACKPATDADKDSAAANLRC